VLYRYRVARARAGVIVRIDEHPRLPIVEYHQGLPGAAALDELRDVRLNLCRAFRGCVRLGLRVQLGLRLGEVGGCCSVTCPSRWTSVCRSWIIWGKFC